MGRLDNRVAIVTGGAKGLGYAFCFALAKEGAKVVMAAHRMDEESQKAVKEIEQKGGFGVVVDVTDEKSRLRQRSGTGRWTWGSRGPGSAPEPCFPI
jgi:NAD(P)-dependent dehydrogenase (short-subunit alcohol dehydrogenase family)